MNPIAPWPDRLPETMTRLSVRLRKFLLGASLLAVAAIAFLEIGSRCYHCPVADQALADPSVCDPDVYPPDQEQLQRIQAAVEAKRAGAEPSRADLERMVERVDYHAIMGLNGVACGNGMVFVRMGLPGQAGYYVARHELEHIFLREGVSAACPEEETCAMWRAARVYPLGFVETILSSLYLSARESPDIGCFLFGSWRIFREHILGLR